MAFTNINPTRRYSLHLQGQNGYGSTNTYIPRFDSVKEGSSSNPLFTYSDSATLGASITVNKACRVRLMIQWYGALNVGSRIGFSKNSAVLNASIDGGIPDANMLTMSSSESDGTSRICHTSYWEGELSAGDVIRPHTNAVASQADTGVHVFVAAEESQP